MEDKTIVEDGERLVKEGLVADTTKLGLFAKLAGRFASGGQLGPVRWGQERARFEGYVRIRRALQSGDDETGEIKEALAAGADAAWGRIPDVRGGGQSLTLLGYALNNNLPQSALALIPGSDLSVKDGHGANALHLASQIENMVSGDKLVLDALLRRLDESGDEARKIMEARNSDGLTPLAIAAEHASPTMVRGLLSRLGQSGYNDAVTLVKDNDRRVQGSPIDFCLNSDAWTDGVTETAIALLPFAVKHEEKQRGVGWSTEVDWILRASATPGLEKLVEIFVSMGIKPTRSSSGMTALMSASKSGSPQMAQILLSLCDPWDCYEDGRTAMDFTAKRDRKTDRLEMLKTLTEAMEKSGSTPRMLAAMSCARGIMFLPWQEEKDWMDARIKAWVEKLEYAQESMPKQGSGSKPRL